MQAVLLAFTVVIVVDAVAGDEGWLARRESDRESTILKAEYDQVVAENAALEERIRRLNEDESLMEELAREFNFIRPGERLFIIKDLPSPAAP